MIRPTQDFVLVKPAAIHLSDTILVNNTEPFNRGTVIAVGPGKSDKRGNKRPPEVAEGDEIRYGNGSYLDWPILEYQGQKYQMIREADICYIEEAA